MSYSLGVFIEDKLVATVPENDAEGKTTLSTMSKLLGRPQKDFEVLMVCDNHPNTPSVACIKCRSAHETV